MQNATVIFRLCSIVYFLFVLFIILLIIISHQNSDILVTLLLPILNKIGTCSFTT